MTVEVVRYHLFEEAQDYETKRNQEQAFEELRAIEEELDDRQDYY